MNAEDCAIQGLVLYIEYKSSYKHKYYGYVMQYNVPVLLINQINQHE